MNNISACTWSMKLNQFAIAQDGVVTVPWRSCSGRRRAVERRRIENERSDSHRSWNCCCSNCRVLITFNKESIFLVDSCNTNLTSGSELKMWGRISRKVVWNRINSGLHRTNFLHEVSLTFSITPNERPQIEAQAINYIQSNQRTSQDASFCHSLFAFHIAVKG